MVAANEVSKELYPYLFTIIAQQVYMVLEMQLYLSLLCFIKVKHICVNYVKIYSINLTLFLVAVKETKGWTR